jgi:hypothetical protein
MFSSLQVMHTSKILQASHFAYRSRGPDGVMTPSPGFETLCPDYHALDRLGIVALPFEAPMQHASLGILAWTTAFYDALRAESHGGFFNYPQHYVFYATDNRGTLVTKSESLTDEAVGSWGHLDVWPDCKQVESPNSVNGIVARLFDFEINRLLWPRPMSSVGDEPRLPEYVRRMLLTRLKGVYLYDSDSPTVEIHAREPVMRLAREAREQAGLRAFDDAAERSVEAYEQIDVDQFLDTYLGSVFEES